LKILGYEIKKKQPNLKPSPNVQTTLTGLPQYTRYIFNPSNTERNIKNGYKGNSLIAGVIGFWQFTFPQAKFKVVPSNEKSKNAKNPFPEIQALLQNPNPEQSEADFKLNIITNILCGGENYILKGRNNSGEVKQLWNYHSGLMQPFYNKAGFLDGYRYYNPTSPLYTKEYKVEDVIHLKWIARDTDNANKGISPIAQCFNEVNLTSEVGRSVYSFLKNDLLKGKVILVNEAQEEQTPEQKRQTKQAWLENTTGDNKGMPVFLEGASIHEVTGSFDELNTENINAEAEAIMARVFGVSPIILEWCVGLKRTSENNVKEADKRFNTRTFAPFLDIISDTITHGLRQDFDGEFDVIMDTSLMESFLEIQMDKEDHYLKMYIGGAFTFDELREKIGMPLLPGGSISSRLRDNVTAWTELRSVMNNYMLGEANMAFGLEREQCIEYVMNLPLGLDRKAVEKLFPKLKPEMSQTTVDENGNPIPAITEAITVRETI